MNHKTHGVALQVIVYKSAGSNSLSRNLLHPHYFNYAYVIIN